MSDRSCLRLHPVSARVRAVLGTVAALELLMLSGGPAQAADAAATGGAGDGTTGEATGLAEVTVTARYRKEDLQTTPIAITAISAAALEDKSLENVKDIGAQIPNAYISAGHPAWGGSPIIRLRGVGQTESLFAFEPGVGLYIDDVYHSTLLGSAFDLMDLQQVEVLRGPQGTLFGMNSLGGAIRLISRKPSGDNAGSFEATYGSFHRLDLKGSFDASLIDNTLFLRVSGVSKHQDGYQKVLDFRCNMIKNGTPELAGSFPFLTTDGQQPGGDCVVGENGGTSLQAGRVMLRYVVNSRLEINLAADYTNEDDESPALSAIAVPGTLSSWVNSTLNPTFGVQLDSRWLLSNPYETYYQTVDPFHKTAWQQDYTTRSWGYSATVDYGITDDIHLKIIGAERGYNAENAADRYGLPLGLNLVGNIDQHRQTSAELQLTGTSFNKFLDWTVGGFYFRSHEFYGGEVLLGSAGLNFNNNDHFVNRNESGFVHLVGHLTDRLSLTAGVRYTDESKDYAFDHPPFLPAAGQPAINANTAYSHTDWKVGVDYKLSKQVFAYADVSTGFREPGFNPRPFDAVQLIAYPAEEMTAYEIGLKNDLFDNRLRVNVDGFYSDYSKWVLPAQGIQCSAPTDYTPPVIGTVCPAGTALAGTPGIPWSVFLASSAKIYGAELDLQASPVENLDIDASFGYNHLDGGQTDPTKQDYIYPGRNATPETNGTLGVQYHLHLGSGGTVTPRLDFTYVGSYTFGTASRAPYPGETAPSVSLVNGRITYDSPKGDWSMAVSGTNLFNHFYWNGFVGNVAQAGGGLSGEPAPPREWAVTFRHTL